MNAAATADKLIPARVFMGGGWIQLLDRTTDEVLQGFNFPKSGPTPAFIRRVLKWAAENHVLVCVGEGLGGGVCFMIG